jgi:D-alanyl-D-alanine carboxypeptidase
LDSSISIYLEGVPATLRPITLRHLMSHSSGLPMDHFNYSKLYGPSALRYTVKEQLADLFKLKLVFEPGTGYNYSNAGFFLQAAIIEKVTGDSYQNFIRKRIFEKAGMRNSTFINGDSIVANRSQGYTRRKGQWVRFSLEAAIQAIDANGFAGVIATAEDEMKFCRALSAGKIIKKETFEKMITATLMKNGSPVDPPGRSGIGLGWFTRDYEGRRCLSHSGHTGTQVVYFPDQNFSVILFTNLTQGYSPLGDRGFRVADATFALADMAIAKWLK